MESTGTPFATKGGKMLAWDWRCGWCGICLGIGGVVGVVGVRFAVGLAVWLVWNLPWGWQCGWYGICRRVGGVLTLQGTHR